MSLWTCIFNTIIQLVINNLKKPTIYIKICIKKKSSMRNVKNNSLVLVINKNKMKLTLRKLYFKGNKMRLMMIKFKKSWIKVSILSIKVKWQKRIIKKVLSNWISHMMKWKTNINQFCNKFSSMKNLELTSLSTTLISFWSMSSLLEKSSINKAHPLLMKCKNWVTQMVSSYL